MIAPKSKSRTENVDLSINFSMIDAQLWSGQVILIVYQKTNHQGAGLPSHSPPEPVFVNVYGAQKSIPRNRFS
jgi:hypothetical protein